MDRSGFHVGPRIARWVRNPPATARSQEWVDLPDGRRIEFELLRMRRRRHAHLYVTEEGDVQIRAQSWFSPGEAKVLVLQHAGWIFDKLAAARRRQDARPALADGATLPFLDEQLLLRLDLDAQLNLPLSEAEAAANSHQGWVLRRGSELVVHAFESGQSEIEELLRGWYRDCAKSALSERLRPLADRVGHRPKKVRIAAQRSRWGSCSSRGTISLNWRLLLLPSAVVDYVLVHELCHLVHMNHSPDFWSLVEQHCANHRELRAWLRQTQMAQIL